MSTMVFQSGCWSGLHMIAPGLMSMGAATERVGDLGYSWAACSVLTKPRVMSRSAYICSEILAKSIAGPPERTSTSTPVALPSTTMGPRTSLRLVSTR